MTATPSLLTGLSDRLYRLGQGDASGWAELCPQVLPVLRPLARRLTGDMHLADDAVQEALIRIPSAARRYRGIDDAAAMRFLVGLGAHVALNLRRRQRRERAHEAGLACADGQCTDAAAPDGGDDWSEALATAMTHLPAPRRDAIRLRLVEGRSYNEVAQTLGVPVATCKTRVHRGVRWLRQRMRDVAWCLALAWRGREVQPAVRPRVGGQRPPGAALRLRVGAMAVAMAWMIVVSCLTVRLLGALSPSAHHQRLPASGTLPRARSAMTPLLGIQDPSPTPLGGDSTQPRTTTVPSPRTSGLWGLRRIECAAEYLGIDSHQHQIVTPLRASADDLQRIAGPAITTDTDFIALLRGAVTLHVATGVRMTCTTDGIPCVAFDRLVGSSASGFDPSSAVQLPTPDDRTRAAIGPGLRIRRGGDTVYVEVAPWSSPPTVTSNG